VWTLQVVVGALGVSICHCSDACHVHLDVVIGPQVLLRVVIVSHQMQRKVVHGLHMPHVQGLHRAVIAVMWRHNCGEH
jgi:hypothetical protein